LIDGQIKEGAQSQPARTDILYALAASGTTTIWSILNGWLIYFYLPPEGEGKLLVPAALYSVVMLVNRVIDAVIDPPIGYLSDHTRSRWGRRLPFMFASALPLLIFFVLVWTPPVQGESIWNLIYIAVVLELYNIAYSFFNIPYNALLPELALTDRHRVRISAWVAGFQTMAMILSSFAGLLVEEWGYAVMALIYAVAVLPIFYLPLFVLRERPGRQITTKERLDFWKGLLVTLRNRPFRIYTITWALYWSTMTLVPAAIPFIATEVCLLTKADTVYFYISAVLASLACYPLVTWLAGKLDRWRVFTGSLLAAALTLSGIAIIGDWLPVPLGIQGTLWVVVEAVAMSGVVVLMPTFAAEITDHDAELTGQRREGSYYAAWGLLDNVLSGAATALVPPLLLLGRSRSDPYGPLGVRMIGVTGGVMMLVAFLVFLRYPLRHRGGKRDS
jgi:GPH family glycoside/pentoside/hexuronide:cation symporter